MRRVLCARGTRPNSGQSLSLSKRLGAWVCPCGFTNEQLRSSARRRHRLKLPSSAEYRMVKLKSASPFFCAYPEACCAMNPEDLQTDHTRRSLFRDERHPLGGPRASSYLESLSTELQRLDRKNILPAPPETGLAMGLGVLVNLDPSQFSLSNTKLPEADEAGGV